MRSSLLLYNGRKFSFMFGIARLGPGGCFAVSWIAEIFKGPTTDLMVTGIRGILKLLAIMGPAGLLLLSMIAATSAGAQNSSYSGGARSGGGYASGKYSGQTYGSKGVGSSPLTTGRAAGIPRSVWRSTPSAPAPWRNSLSPGALPGRILAPSVKDYTSYSGYYGSYGIAPSSADLAKAAAEEEESPTDPAAPSADAEKSKGAGTN